MTTRTPTASPVLSPPSGPEEGQIGAGALVWEGLTTAATAPTVERPTEAGGPCSAPVAPAIKNASTVATPAEATTCRHFTVLPFPSLRPGLAQTSTTINGRTAGIRSFGTWFELGTRGSKGSPSEPGAVVELPTARAEEGEPKGRSGHTAPQVSSLQRRLTSWLMFGSRNRSSIDEELYHATLPEHGESHVGHLGPLFWSRAHFRGYLVLTSHRLIFVRTPTPLRRSFDPLFELRLNQVTKLSVVAGRLSSAFSTDTESFTVPHVASSVKPYVVTGFRDLVAKTRQSLLEEVRNQAASSQPNVGTHHPPPIHRGRVEPPVTREREVIKEIVKVPCRYCGNLVSVTDVKCPTCSAPFTR